MSEASYSSEMLESETDIAELEACMDVIDEYYYGIRILPGQDPASVYVGWISSGFHQQSDTFDMKQIRNVVVCTLDYENQIKSRWEIHAGYHRINAWFVLYIIIYVYFDGLVQERRNSSVSAMELRLSCTKPLICQYHNIFSVSGYFNFIQLNEFN